MGKKFAMPFLFLTAFFSTEKVQKYVKNALFATLFLHLRKTASNVYLIYKIQSISTINSNAKNL